MRRSRPRADRPRRVLIQAATATAAYLVVAAAAARADSPERLVGAARWGVTLEGGPGLAVMSAPGGTSVGLSQRQGVRVDRPGRLLFRLGLRRIGAGDGDDQRNAGERRALRGGGRMTVDLGVGLRTRQRRKVTAFAVGALAVGASMMQYGSLGEPIPADPSEPTTTTQAPVLAPELTVGAQWWPRRWIMLGVTSTYSPTWAHGALIHVTDTVGSLGLAL